MAEVVGVLGVAVQLTEVGIKLRKALAEIKAAPDNIYAILDEATACSELLENIQELGKASGGRYVTYQRHFTRALEDLTELARRLKNDITTSRISGSFKAYVKKGDVEKYVSKLERAKTTLLVAQQTYQSKLQLQQQHLLQMIHDDLKASNLQMQATTRSESLSDVSYVRLDVCSQDESDGSIAPYKKTGFAGFRSHCTVTKALHLRLPAWLLKKALKVYFCQSSSTINFSFRVYNQISKDSDVVRAAKEGDLQRLQKLFTQRLAGHFDVTSTGETLLHVAARKAPLETITFLLQNGCDVSALNEAGRTPLEEFLARSMMRNGPQRLRGTQLLVINNSTIWQDGFIYERALGYQDASCAAVIVGCFHDAALPLTKNVRALWAIISLSSNPDAIAAKLGENLSLVEAFSLGLEISRYFNHTILLHIIAIQHRIYLQNKHWIADDFDHAYGAVLPAIFDFENKLQKPTRMSLSPLTAFLSGFYPTKPCAGIDWNDFITSLAMPWFNCLDHYGVNPEHYGRMEHKMLRDSFEGCPYTFYFAGSGGGQKRGVVTIVGLTWGATVAEWKIWVKPGPSEEMFKGQYCDDEEYEMAGAFWMFVENPELVLIPGTFLTYHEYCTSEQIRAFAPTAFDAWFCGKWSVLYYVTWDYFDT